MAVTRANIDIIQQQLPADHRQRKLAALFTSSPGENVLPYPYWYHNVVPTARGFKSVNYSQLEAIPPVDITIEQLVHPSYGEVPTAELYTVPIYVANNKLYTFDFKVNVWREDFDLPNSNISPTVAYVSGTSYLFHPSIGLKKLVQGSWVDVTLDWGTGVTPPPLGDFIGIANNTGYLVLYDRTTIYWSAPDNPEMFGLEVAGVPTGAGSSRIQALLGYIQNLKTLAGGAIIYSNKNAISMRYTNNARNPWVFTELPDSAGITAAHHVVVSPSGAAHYAWTTQGLMQLTLGQGKRILPEWTQVLSSEEYSLDGATEVQTVNTRVNLRMSLAVGSALIISVGEEGKPYNAAWVYDLDLGRWGRLQYDHWDIVSYTPLEDPDIVTYREMTDNNWTFASLRGRTIRSLAGSATGASAVARELAVIGADGFRHKADLSSLSDGADAFVLIGDVRITHSKATTLQSVKLQTAGGAPKVEACVLGVDPLWVEFIHNTYTPDEWVEFVSGNALTLKVSGDFTISSIEIALQQAGYVL